MTGRHQNDVRLLLVEYDDLVELWDALLAHEVRFDDPGDYGFEVTRRLRERVGELMAVMYDRKE